MKVLLKDVIRWKERGNTQYTSILIFLTESYIAIYIIFFFFILEIHHKYNLFDRLG